MERHACDVDKKDGSILRNISFQLTKIPETRITNTPFWVFVFKSCVHPNPKFGSTFFYERLLPYLVSMPILSALQTGVALQVCINDFRKVPRGGDYSFMNAAVESIRFVARLAGLTERESNHFPLLIRWGMLKCIMHDLHVVKSVTPGELDLILLAKNSVSYSAGCQSRIEVTLTEEQLKEVNSLLKEVDERVKALDMRVCQPPLLELNSNIELSGICDWSWFGRLRQDFDVEKLAGGAPIPPIYRPIELTLVPEKVSTFEETANAMRHCLNLCVLLSNQRALVRNSYTLRMCLIQHLFVRVIPLPLPVTHNDRDARCFWHAQPMRYETQADILRLLNMICRHFATASLSVKITRSGDAARMLTFCLLYTSDAADE